MPQVATTSRPRVSHGLSVEDMGFKKKMASLKTYLGMDKYLYIPFLGG
jgi:hypothetical protein